MSTDDLKSFVDRHREAFDEAPLPDHVWGRIQKELQPTDRRQPVRQLRRWHYAAAATILIAIGIGIGLWFARPGFSVPDAALVELRETEAYYQSRVDRSLRQLREAGALPVVAKDLQEMNDYIATLKSELDQVPDAHRQEVIRSIILNYQLKVDLLERILQQTPSQNRTSHDQI
ncbi:MAG: hypothetical protein H6568_07740 [Lewinellaceae bacterium]|nr:hypothetical protein [Saprospiraceae bacterium]MCB9312645.1 hypothetical protein [Lewinellaceae bacterium]HRW74253.1 hypothetical protein [Saprospiraceae bacterium]